LKGLRIRVRCSELKVAIHVISKASGPRTLSRKGLANSASSLQNIAVVSQTDCRYQADRYFLSA